MASQIFTYSPTTGTGNASVTVTASSINQGTSDRSATITITGGTDSVDVGVKQLHKPYVLQTATAIPSTGGSITITANSEYDVVFSGIPAWLSVASAFTPVQEGQRITLPANHQGVFTLSAATNNDTARSATTLEMLHYVGNTLMTGYGEAIEVTQDRAPGPITTGIPCHVALVGTIPNGNTVVAVRIYGYGGTYDDINYTLSTIVSQDTDTFYIGLDPNYDTNIHVEVSVTRNTGNFKVNLEYTYGEDTLSDTAITLGDTSDFYTTYQPGETMDIEVELTMPI